MSDDQVRHNRQQRRFDRTNGALTEQDVDVFAWKAAGSIAVTDAELDEMKHRVIGAAPPNDIDIPEWLQWRADVDPPTTLTFDRGVIALDPRGSDIVVYMDADTATPGEPAQHMAALADFFQHAPRDVCRLIREVERLRAGLRPLAEYGGTFDYDRQRDFCTFCKAVERLGDWGGIADHIADCPVTFARALLGEE